MSSKLVICVVLMCFAYCSFGAISISAPYEHPDHPGKCYDQEKNEALPVGDSTKHSDGCYRVTCGKDLSISWESCGVIGLEPECELGKEDFSQSYPDCCPKPVCSL